MAQTSDQQPANPEQSKQDFRLGCAILAGLAILIGGCSALVNNDSDDAPESVVVEDYTGLQLQLAQDTAQDDGLYDLNSIDLSGLGRAQVWDRNWQVCSQVPEPGTEMSPDDQLVFEVVKTEEACP
ncbi:PASTA domain-containing protein [Streptomyces sp. NPDC005551]|uniref:PASTA domain-containing protein n=1 Tax=Streptomyces sp. NPDC005551 TaxID=3364725 RepID=UPI0036833EDE